jgi:capsular exopolysaccharide synthesis family protein
MSKIFDMLQLADDRRQANTLIAHASAGPSPVEIAVTDTLNPAEPILAVGDEARQELSKIVHQLESLPEGCRTLAFSAVRSGSGCSWLLGRIAEALTAKYAGAVCLVDANLRSPSLHELFGVPNHQCGLSDALASSAPVQRFLQQVRSDLSLMTCGSSCPHPGAAVKLATLRTRLRELRNRFAWVLIDAPPLNAAGDAIAFARAADGAIVVVEANVTQRDAARKAIETLVAANVRVLGAVLNKRTFPIPSALYKHL